MTLELEHVVVAVIFAGVVGTTLIFASKKQTPVLDLTIYLVVEVVLGLIAYAGYRYFFVGHL